MTLRRLGQGSRNKPRSTLVLLLRPVQRRAGAREISRDMEQNSEDEEFVPAFPRLKNRAPVSASLR